MSYRYLIVLPFFTIIFYIVDANQSNQLYTDDDPMHLLNSSTFETTIFGKDKAWIVEFYNRWCGHCARFAPTWKEFARDVEAWKSVVDVAAIDCADTQNVDTCRNYRVAGFPTVKYFWVNVTKKDKGEDAGHNTDVQSLRKGLINFLEDNWRLGVPKHWPEIRSYRIDEVQETLNHDRRILAVIIEPPKSYVGKETILDMSSYPDARIVRVLASTDDLPKREFAKNTEIKTLPVLIILKRDNSADLAVEPMTSENARFEFVSALKKKILGTKWNDLTNHSFHPADEDIDSKPIQHRPRPSGTTSLQTAVYMADLENAVVYSLRQEIGMNNMLNGEELTSLKLYLRTLSKHFPGRAPVVGFLKELYRWVSEKHNRLFISEFLTVMDDIQSSNNVYLPKLQPWVGCKGSSDRYRGYPCSLWTLFHTLTIDALWKYRQGKGSKPQQVMLSVRNYVRDFFTCTECSANFMQMATSIERELQNPYDGVLWLWNAHNHVNKRLAGDTTEDPEHPKVQFPPRTLCPHCWLSDKLDQSGTPHWNKTAVLEFLLSFYKKSNINLSGIEEIPHVVDNTINTNVKETKNDLDQVFPAESNRNNAAERDVSEKTSSGWSFKYFSEADVSLCIILYVSSGALLILAALIFKLRKRRRRMRNGKLFISQP